MVKDKEPEPQYHFITTKCGTCNRPLLIEQWVNGSNHTMGLTVICAECITLPFPADFEKNHSIEAEEIKKWLDEIQQTTRQ